VCTDRLTQIAGNGLSKREARRHRGYGEFGGDCELLAEGDELEQGGALEEGGAFGPEIEEEEANEDER
jgi:hypothetical protein